MSRTPVFRPCGDMAHDDGLAETGRHDDELSVSLAIDGRSDSLDGRPLIGPEREGPRRLGGGEEDHGNRAYSVTAPEGRKAEDLDSRVARGSRAMGSTQREDQRRFSPNSRRPAFRRGRGGPGLAGSGVDGFSALR